MNPGKRALDLIGASVGLLVLWPLFLAVALLIKWEDGGSVFFRQMRVGYRGERFRIWKFRTMVVEAERIGPRLTVGDDSRITQMGRWLRRSKIDEFPQLLNVLVGKMSLVGPRPEVAEYVALYNEDQRRVLELMPGITDPASLEYRNENETLAEVSDPQTAYVKEIMPAKIRINLAYAERATLGSDLMVIFKTLGAFLGLSRKRMCSGPPA